MSRGPSCPQSMAARRRAVDEALGFQYTDRKRRRGAQISGLGAAASRFARRYGWALVEIERGEPNPSAVGHQGVDRAFVPTICLRVERDLEQAGIWQRDAPAPVIPLSAHRRR